MVWGVGARIQNVNVTTSEPHFISFRSWSSIMLGNARIIPRLLGELLLQDALMPFFIRGSAFGLNGYG